MITSLSEMKYLKVEIVWKESSVYIKNNFDEIARYILSHQREYLIFYSLDNYVLFYWTKKQVEIPDSVFISFSDMPNFLESLNNSLLKEKAILPRVYNSITPFRNSFICLYPQITKGSSNYNFLSLKIETSLSFDKVMDSLNIDVRQFTNEVVFLLCTFYIGNNFPAPKQYLDYNSYKFQITLNKGNTDTCYFDTANQS